MKKLISLLLIFTGSFAFAQSDSSNYFTDIGRGYQGQNKNLLAYENYIQALKFDANYLPAIEGSAEAAIEMRKLPTAIEHLEKAYQIAPTNQKISNNLLKLLYDYQQYDKALKLAQSCTSCDNRDKITGMIYYKDENYAKAEKALLKAIAINSKDADANYTLARTYIDLEFYNKAIPYYVKTLEIEPSRASVHNELGLVYYNQSQYDKAVSSFEAALKHGYKANLDFTENLGFAAIYNGQIEKGEQALNSILEKKPGNTNLLRGIADALYDRKQYDKSLTYCQKLMEINPKDAKALYKAGLNFLKKGDKERGQKLCDEAIKLDPSMESMRTKKEIMM